MFSLVQNQRVRQEISTTMGALSCSFSFLLGNSKLIPARRYASVLARSWHGQHVGFACGAKSVDFAATANN